MLVALCSAYIDARTCLMVCHSPGQVWSMWPSATEQKPRIHPSEQGNWDCSKHLSSLSIKSQHRKRWKVEGKTAVTLRKSAEPLMRYLLQIIISQLVKNHPQKVPFMLVNESSGRFFVQDKEHVKKKYRQPNSKMSARGSLCRSRTGTRLSCEGHLIERK